MLKFIFMSMLMLVCVNNWTVVLFSMFLLSFLMGSLSISGSGMLINNLGFGLSLDFMSYVLILLSIWIMALVVMSSQFVLDKNNFTLVFLFVNLLLLLSLILSFSTMDSMVFYISFESALLPTMILILGWGYQPERIQAGVYMVFYTLFGSLPLLVSLLSLYKVCGTTIFCLSFLLSSGSLIQIWYIMSVVAFVVKLPMFMVHLWLPKAHVEAPVAGSMILAGVLLKLGGYGLVRICPIFSSVVLKFSWIWAAFGLAGGVLVSLTCMRQIDMKSLIAYSSVAHMGLVLAGIMVFSWWGISGAVGVMIGHGLCSSGLFSLANMSYERTGSRSMLVSKGLLNVMPSLGLWWFLLSISNMAAPPTISLMAEILLITSVVSFSWVVLVPVALLSFLSAAYSLYMYILTQHGKYFNALFSCSSGNIREYYILILHWFPLNILILKSGLLYLF